MNAKTLFLLGSAAILTGCATNDYALYAETQKAIAQARAVSEAARYNALAEIAKTGGDPAKVAAVLSIQMGGSPNSQPAQNVAPPKTFGDTALQWTSVLLPSLTQMYGIAKNTEVNIAQSNNSALVARSTNEAFVGIAGNIQAPQANVTTTTTNTDSSNRSTNTTTTTTSTSSIGRDNNTGANSGNTGKVAGGSQTDNTSTPTIVKPDVVNTNTTNTTTTNSNNTTTTGGGG